MIKRIIAGHRNGKSNILSTSPSPITQIFRSMPGMEYSLLWATRPLDFITGDDAAEAVHPEIALLPGPGETRFLMLQIPPQSVVQSPSFDVEAAGAEFVALQPEMAALQEPDNPGMHRTESIDYVIVLDGEVDLELDDGEEIHLTRSNAVVQIGTRHAWRNRSTQPVTLAIVLVGANRQD